LYLILQHEDKCFYCDQTTSSQLIYCSFCPKAYHRECLPEGTVISFPRWYVSTDSSNTFSVRIRDFQTFFFFFVTIGFLTIYQLGVALATNVKYLTAVQALLKVDEKFTDALIAPPLIACKFVSTSILILEFRSRYCKFPLFFDLIFSAHLAEGTKILDYNPWQSIGYRTGSFVFIVCTKCTVRNFGLFFFTSGPR